MATFVYDGDGNRVRSTINGTTTTFVGGIYEVTGSQITKYYFAGTQRIATPALAPGASVRTGSTLSYLLSDHLGSTSLTTNTSGTLVSEVRYKPWGETRLTIGTIYTDKLFTGQRDPLCPTALRTSTARSARAHVPQIHDGF